MSSLPEHTARAERAETISRLRREDPVMAAALALVLRDPVGYAEACRELRRQEAAEQVAAELDGP